MPELPEVNTFKRYFDETSLNQVIDKVVVHDDKIIRNVSGSTFARRLKHRQFIDSYRRGKYLFAHLDNGHHVLFHFGMTGDLAYYADNAVGPKHERFVIQFANGYRLGFDCPRKFARILYLDDLTAYLEEVGLGEDALTIPQKSFLQLMEGRKGAIKGFLLNQQLVAGVGNLYADEICFQTRIHPASRVDKLSLAQRKAIYKKMKSILKLAVKREAHYKAYPKDWFWEWRKEGAIGPENSKVEKATIAGRSTFFCQGYQINYQ
ncbi:MAG: DNA-formamidopyrimidine glycosylase family protein [Bacteroidota bacterium]